MEFLIRGTQLANFFIIFNLTCYLCTTVICYMIYRKRDGKQGIDTTVSKKRAKVLGLIWVFYLYCMFALSRLTQLEYFMYFVYGLGFMICLSVVVLFLSAYRTAKNT